MSGHMHQYILSLHGSELAANDANILMQGFGSLLQFAFAHVVRNDLPGNDSLRSYEGLKWVFLTNLLMPIKVVVREELVTCFTSEVHAKSAFLSCRQFKIGHVTLEESRTATSVLSFRDHSEQQVSEVGIVG